MRISLLDEVRYILSKLNQNGFEGFVVGGCVRDSIIGRDISDWDITTNAVPEDVIRIFSDEKKYLCGIKHGTVTLIINSIPFEITTYRIDGYYRDFRRPESISFSTKLDEDLKRRDFTINAMAYNEHSGLIDAFNGKNDIENKIVRCVGNPDKRFMEDALRMLRAVRFTAQLGFLLDCETEKSIINNAYLIKNISNERVRDEITKIIMSNNPGIIYSPLIFRLFHYILPETYASSCIVPDENGRANNQEFNTGADLGDTLELRMAFLLHEIAGCNHCSKASLLEECCSILEMLRFDKKTIVKVKMLIKYHDAEILEDRKSIRLWLSRVGPDNLRDLIRFKKTLKNSMNAVCVPENSDCINIMDINFKQVLENGDCYERNKLALDGNDIRAMGYSEGRYIGYVIDMLLNAVIKDPSMNTKENLKQYVLELVNSKKLP